MQKVYLYPLDKWYLEKNDCLNLPGFDQETSYWQRSLIQIAEKNKKSQQSSTLEIDDIRSNNDNLQEVEKFHSKKKRSDEFGNSFVTAVDNSEDLALMILSESTATALNKDEEEEEEEGGISPPIRRWIPRDKKKTREEMQEEREAELSDEASEEIRHYYRMKKIDKEEYERKRALLRDRKRKRICDSSSTQKAPSKVVDDDDVDDIVNREDKDRTTNGIPDNDFSRVHSEDQRFYEAVSKNKKKTCDIKQSLAFK